MAVTISNSGVKCDSVTVTRNVVKNDVILRSSEGVKKAKKLLACLMCGPLHHC